MARKKDLDDKATDLYNSMMPSERELAIQAEIDEYMAKVAVLQIEKAKLAKKRELQYNQKCKEVYGEANILVKDRNDYLATVAERDLLQTLLDSMDREFRAWKLLLTETFTSKNVEEKDKEDEPIDRLFLTLPNPDLGNVYER